MSFANRNIIVGLDPGTTVGVAILDTKGRVILVASKKNAKKNDVVSLISNFGRPIVIGTDRNPPPKYVQRVSSNFGSRIFYPEDHMTVKEKRNIVKNFSEEIKNSHEVDALAATLKAWKNYRKTFESKKFGGFLEWLRRN